MKLTSEQIATIIESVQRRDEELAKLLSAATEVNVASKVTLSKPEYDSLVRDSDKLAKLEAYGVANWSGYDDALHEAE